MASLVVTPQSKNWSPSRRKRCKKKITDAITLVFLFSSVKILDPSHVLFVFSLSFIITSTVVLPKPVRSDNSLMLTTVLFYHYPHRIHQSRIDNFWPTRSLFIFSRTSAIWEPFVPLIHKRVTYCGSIVDFDYIFIVGTGEFPRVAHNLMMVRCFATLKAAI